MNLRCHALLKSGEMCGARANSLCDGHPACDRLAHRAGQAKFKPMTAGSVYPHKLRPVLMTIGFLNGDSVEAVAAQYGETKRAVENIIREML